MTTNHTANVPLSIGMPVYNGVRTVTKAVESLLGQSCGDFILFISDNASTDGTSAILRAYAERDQRIRYVRQPRNRGAGWNFEFVLRQANTPYFMWAAADDYWGVDFVRDNLAQLRADPRVVLSASQTTFVGKDQTLRPAADTFPLTRSAAANIGEYIDNPSTNSRFYGIFKRSVIVYACDRALGHYPASDWAMMVHTLRFGIHAEVGRCQFYRHVGGASENARRFLGTFRRDPLNFFFPMARFSLAALRVGAKNRSPWLFLSLLRHNAKYFLWWFMPLINLVPSGIRLYMKRLLRMDR